MPDNLYRAETWLAVAPIAGECLASNLGCDLAILGRVDGGSFSPLWTSDPAGFARLSVGGLTHLARQVTHDGSPVCLPEWVEGGSTLAVPLLGLPDDPGIVLVLLFEQRRPLVARDVRFAVNIASLLSEAGQGAWLREKLFQPVVGDDAARSRRAQQRASYLETLNYISESARNGVLFNEIAKQTMQRLTSGLDIGFGALYFGLDGAWILVDHVGFDARFPLFAGYLSAALLPWTANVEPSSDFEPGEPLAGSFRAANLTSWAVVPLLEDSAVRGGMILATKETAYFTDEVVAMLSRISHQLHAAMLQARLSRDLAEQTADLQAVIGSLSDALIEVTADRSIMQANAAALKLLGVRVGGKRADDWHDLLPLYDLHRDEPAGDRHPIVRTFTQARSQSASPWRLIKDGKTAYLSVTAAPILDEKNTGVRAAVLVLRDVTEQRAAEQKLLSAEKHASVSSLAAGVAHEFKNYLGGIMGNAGLAQRVAGDQEVIATAMQRILEIGARANQTALSLLSYVQESGDEPQVLDLGNLAGEVICLMEQRAVKQGIRMERAVALDLCIQGTATKVRQIMLNLLNNAVEAMPNGGTLHLTLSGDPVSAHLEIKDTGIGIPPQNLGRVFDPFFSTKGVWGREAGAGTGLGLTTSSNYVRELGGELALESTPGLGTRVRVTFPRVCRLGSADEAGRRADIPKSAIILETDPDAREVLASALTSRSWRVTIVAHAHELQAELAQGAPGVAFLDALMPGKINFIRAFDALVEQAPRCRVVVTTGAATDYQLLEYIQAAAGRLVKPLSNDQVGAFIETQLAGAVPS